MCALIDSRSEVAVGDHLTSATVNSSLDFVVRNSKPLIELVDALVHLSYETQALNRVLKSGVVRHVLDRVQNSLLFSHCVFR